MKHEGGELDELGWVRVRRGKPMTLPCQNVMIHAERPTGNVFVGKRQGGHDREHGPKVAPAAR